MAREVLTPFGPQLDDGEERYIPEPRTRGRPFSPMQALMEAPPHDEPETSELERLALRDILADALDDLDPRDRRLIEARVIEKRSFRSLERELGLRKSHMQRTERRLLEELAVRLQDQPAVAAYLGRHDPVVEEMEEEGEEESDD